MKKFAAVEPERFTKFEEKTREQHKFNPFTSIIGVLVVLAFAIVLARLVITILTAIF